MVSDKLLYFEFLCLGAGVLIGWNAILTAMDWFGDVFGEFNPSFILPICNFMPSPIFQPLTVFKGHLISFNKRIIVGFAIIGAILVIMPIVAGAVPGAAGFGLLCCLVAFMGAANAVCQTSVFGMAGMMPDEYTRAVMLGNACAGLILSIARIICLASFPPTSTGLIIGTIVYFAIAGGTLVVCCFIQMHVTKHPLVKHHVLDKYSTAIAVTPNDKLITKEESEMSKDFTAPVDVVAQISYKDLFKRIWVFAGLVFLNYVITFVVFPGVSIATSVEGLPYAWFVVLLVTTYNIFDALGRQAVSLYMLSQRVLIFLTFGRLLFWMTCVMIAAHVPPPAIFSGAWFIFLNMALFAFTNGYYSTQHMIYGPAQVEGYLRDKAGSIMSTGLVSGIFVGSVMSLMFSTV
mmetsp:Transcript_19146/g.34927  ORF Transcript_19146/g.34927 Transcript_19146/m.34927 type:complete len:404 (+) Transcript_19146:208-1419(+)